MKIEGMGVRLREERERLKLNQEEIAAFAGTNRMTPNRYEKGLYLPTLPFLDAISGVGVDVDYVLLGKHGDVTLSFKDAAQLGVAVSIVSDLLEKHRLEVSDEVKGSLIIKLLRMAELMPRDAKMKVPSLVDLLSQSTP
ncbi:helix-turn-helix transcriptional regulator [Rhodoferax bucti]|uniref:helix-turn-helix transcriptional regulator n=1 Tax=Rhodoferax bucti TaxID=2576305 RepID=UPI001107C4CB|nr:helix-turn-helix transcriptional regulator [Rhodoferax bucti]